MTWQDLYRVIQGKTPLQTLIDPGEDEPDFFVPGFNARGGRTTAQWMRALGGKPFSTLPLPRPPVAPTLDQLLRDLPGQDPDRGGRSSPDIPAYLGSLDPTQALDDLSSLGDLASRVTFNPSWSGARTGAEIGGLTGGLGGAAVAGPLGAGAGAGIGTLGGAIVGGLGPGLRPPSIPTSNQDAKDALTRLENEYRDQFLYGISPDIDQGYPISPADTPTSYEPAVSTSQEDLGISGDPTPEGTEGGPGSGNPLNAALGGIQIAKAFGDTDQSDAGRILQGLSGATTVYNSLAPYAGMEQIPYVGTALKLANLGLNAYNTVSDDRREDARKAFDILADIVGTAAGGVFPGAGMIGGALQEINRQVWPDILSHAEREALETQGIGGEVRGIIGGIADAETAEDLHRLATQANFTFGSDDPSAWLNVPMAHGATPAETLQLLLRESGGANVQAGINDSYKGPMNTALNAALRHQASLIQAAETATAGSPIPGRKYFASDIDYAARHPDKYPDMSYPNLDAAQIDRAVGQHLVNTFARPGGGWYGPWLSPDLIYNQELSDALRLRGYPDDAIETAQQMFREQAPQLAEIHQMSLVDSDPGRATPGGLGNRPADALAELTGISRAKIDRMISQTFWAGNIQPDLGLGQLVTDPETGYSYRIGGEERGTPIPDAPWMPPPMFE